MHHSEPTSLLRLRDLKEWIGLKRRKEKRLYNEHMHMTYELQYHDYENILTTKISRFTVLKTQH